MVLRFFISTSILVTCYCLLGQGQVSSTYLNRDKDEIGSSKFNKSGKKNKLKKNQNQLENFYRMLEDYKLNAPWITSELMSLDAEQLEQAFERVINILINKDSRWQYFSNSPQDFIESKYWFQSLWQCKFYEYWIENVYVNLLESQFKLYLKNDPKEQLSQNYIKLISFWSFMGSKSKAYEIYKKFYAFYFDCLSHVYCHSVQWASNVFSHPSEFNYAFRYTRTCYNKMRSILQKLASFEDKDLAQIYIANFKRYEEILSVLNSEKIKFRASGGI